MRLSHVTHKCHRFYNAPPSFKHKETAKKSSKATFDRHVNLRSFNDGDLVLAYDITHDTLNHRKFEPL
jgi:hypothetical protein